MKYKIYISFVFIALIFIALIGAFRTTISDRVSEENSLVIPVTEFTPSLSKHLIDKDDVGLQTYKVTITKDQLSRLSGELYMIILNKLGDHGLNVYIDDSLIFSAGDIVNGKSNFKYGYHIMYANADLFKESSILTIETYSLYKSGLETDNVVITENNIGMKIAQQLLFSGPILLYFSFGLLIFSALFIILIYFMYNKEDRSLLYCGFATILYSVYFLDYVNMNLAIDYLTFKKIVLLSMFIGGYFYLLAASRFFNSRFLRKAIAVITVIFFFLTLWAPTMIDYKGFYDYFFLSFLACVGVVFILSVKNLRKSEYAYLILIGFLACAVFIAFSVITELLGLSFSINSPLIYIVVIASLPLLIGIDTILQKQKQLNQEKEMRAVEFLNANTDSLTGVWNQRYLFHRLAQLKNQSNIAIIDLDDFKKINDEYGHLAGDEVLKAVTSRIKSWLEKDMECCRYGGDEFVILAPNSTYRETKNLLQSLCKEIDNSTVTYEQHKIHVTISVGLYEWSEDMTLNEALKNADKALYESKAHGKNGVW